MKDIICIYHANCADGFTAAWAVWKRFGDNVEFFPGVHGQNPPDVKNKRVIIVDFSYKPAVLKEMAKHAKSFLILDHHKSAVEEMKAFKNPEGQLFIHMKDTYSGDLSWDRHVCDSYQDECENIPTAIIYTNLDMDKSGARLAWEFFHPEKKIPDLVLHVEDRDLWKFKMFGTREIQAVVFSHEYDFEKWDDLSVKCENYDDFMTMVNEGKAIERKHFKDVAELIAVSKREMLIGGHWVWCANLPYTMASDACHQMCKMDLAAPDEAFGLTSFAASYWDGPNGRTFSLRSLDAFDVSEVARKYGGGGHKNAAGFTMPIGWEGDNA